MVAFGEISLTHYTINTPVARLRASTRPQPWLLFPLAHAGMKVALNRRFFRCSSSSSSSSGKRLAPSHTEDLCDTQRKDGGGGFIITSCLGGSSLQALLVCVIFNSSGSGDNITSSHVNVTTEYLCWEDLLWPHGVIYLCACVCACERARVKMYSRIYILVTDCKWSH